MDITHPTHHFVHRTSFHLLTPDQIRRLSVKAITQPEIFDALNHPIKGGLYDPSLGPIDKHARCATCGLGAFQCPGHFGHIELAVPVYAPLTFAQMFQLLRQTCLYCHRFRSGTLKTQICMMRLQLLEVGLLGEARDLENLIHQREGQEETTPKLDAVLDRLRSHVDGLLARAKEEGSRPGRNPKLAAVANYRARVIADFLKGSSSTSTVCLHCRGYIPGLYRHGGTKVFMNPLRKNLQVMMDAKGMDPEQLFKRPGLTNEEEEGEEEEEDLAKRGKDEEGAIKGMKFLTPMHVYEHLRLLWKHETVLCQMMFGSQLKKLPSGRVPVDHRIFFSQVLAVPPSRFRPPSVFGGDQFDHPQNTYLVEIIKLNRRIVELRQNMAASPKGGKRPLDRIDVDKGSATIPSFAELIKTWVALQEQVNYLFDSSKNTSTGKVAPPGVKQILEKKEGLFRKHMMGKRVNFAARSVISPDPNLETSEIGVPMVFAKRLTYPEPVTEFNVAELRQAVINGPDVHPGATLVQMEDGTLANLETMSKSARVALANQLLTPSASALVAGEGAGETAGGGLAAKRVMRHIRNNDIVLMNRQPTLHKPSIMAHRVRVLPGEKTIRMHYANCNTYNADFDGDEMNMHFPQSELGRAEAYHIANTNNQYLVPTDGSPLRGLIQDHIVSGVILTLKDTWMTRETYQQLLWGALPESQGRVLTIPPAIIKPQPLWSGKQIITTVLLNLTRGRPCLNMSCTCKISAKMWGKSHAEEAQVVISDGYLATGVMDKSQFGASAYGITHAVYELYGPDAAGSLLSTIGRLLTRFDQYIGFTCRMDDLILDEAANERRAALIRQSHAIGRQVVADYAKVDADDREAVRGALERILRSDELLKGLDGLMKVKMNELTSKIIETCLPEGQLKPFPRNNMSLMTLSGAKGSMVNFSQIAGLLGQQELEGRRVPTMVSGKTHPAFPAFDPRARAGGYITQRFLTGIRPQEFFFHCMAGREGLIDTAVKTSRSGYLQRCLIKHLESLKVSYDSTVRESDGSVLQFYYGEDGLDVVRQKYLRNFGFAARNFALVAQQVQPAVALERVNTEAAVRAARKTAKKPHKYEPVLARFNPNVFLGATSERFSQELEAFLATTQGAQLVPDATQFRAVMWLRYMRALADAGEAVGLLAAQSIGEPSTQMTLNTFHFAGFGAKNVTLGIPRLREIIMTASQQIKTPSITVPLVGDAQRAMDAETLARRLSKLTLRQLIRDISVEERLVEASQVGPVAVNLGRRARVYSITLSLMPLREAEEAFGVELAEIRQAIENTFVRVLLAAMEKTFKRLRANAAAALVSQQALKKLRTISISEDNGVDNARPEREAEDSDADTEAEDEPTGEDAGAKKTLRMQAATQERSSDDEEGEGEGEGEGEEGGVVVEVGEVGEEKPGEMERDEMHGSAMDVDTPLATSTTSSSSSSSSSSTSSPMSRASKGSVLAQTRIIRNYQFNTQSMTVRMDLVLAASQPKLLLLDILERNVQDVIVRQIPGIARVFPHRDDNAPSNSPPTAITTEGANLRGLWEHPLTSTLLDLRHLLSNDIHAVLTTYGVEAARATIVREVAAVFAVYGISVDPRHLSLIADYMTVEGGYRPFNRMGMAATPSPLLQMTFETTVGFLRQAALLGDWDDCESPSARIVMGLPVKLGTGSFEIRQPLYVPS